MDEPFRGLGRERWRDAAMAGALSGGARRRCCASPMMSETLICAGDCAGELPYHRRRHSSGAGGGPRFPLLAMLDAEEQVRQMLWSDADYGGHVGERPYH
ncbi:MAG: hypothetical protein H6669_17625 [Ardenticatenaceae bacterium]|nr:hypothetical protein [Ardenticatenaceae bacterium]